MKDYSFTNWICVSLVKSWYGVASERNINKAIINFKINHTNILWCISFLFNFWFIDICTIYNKQYKSDILQRKIFWNCENTWACTCHTRDKNIWKSYNMHLYVTYYRQIPVYLKYTVVKTYEFVCFKVPAGGRPA